MEAKKTKIQGAEKTVEKKKTAEQINRKSEEQKSRDTEDQKT